MSHYEGRRGIITTHEEDGMILATKKAKDTTKKGAINKEIQLLQYMKKHDIFFIPDIKEFGDGRFTYPWIPGLHFKQAYKQGDTYMQQKLLLNLLDKAYQLDSIGVIHGEMIRPFTNMLVTEDQDVMIIDFERGAIGDTSGKNMRSYSQRLLAEGWISLSDCKKLGGMGREEIYTFLYKKISMNNILSIKSKNIYMYILGAIGGLVWLDQITKYMFYDLARGDHYLLLTPILNTGSGRSLPIPIWLILLLTVSISITVLFLWRKKHISTSSMILILGGALGNGIDRVVYDGVRDFIDLQYRPIFNMADIYLTIVVVLLLIASIQEYKGNV